MRKKWRLVYLDVMAGPGLCKIKETGEEFPGSPFVALDYDFHKFVFIEDHPDLADALKQRVRKHPKADLVEVIPKNWVEVVREGNLRFSDDTLVRFNIVLESRGMSPNISNLILDKPRWIRSWVQVIGANGSGKRHRNSLASRSIALASAYNGRASLAHVMSPFLRTNHFTASLYSAGIRSLRSSGTRF